MNTFLFQYENELEANRLIYIIPIQMTHFVGVFLCRDNWWLRWTLNELLKFSKTELYTYFYDILNESRYINWRDYDPIRIGPIIGPQDE